MAPRSTVILGTGSYTPERILTNDELSRMVDTSDEWIVTRSGIRERRIAAPDEETSDMAVHAARRALDDSGLKPADIDLLVVATFTPDMRIPAVACVIQQKLGIPTAAACFDLNAACSGFIYALDVASSMVATGRYRKALVVAVEKLSSVVDWKDRSTCVLFGDAAGAAVVGASPEAGRGVLGTRLGAVGNTELLFIPGGGSTSPASPESVANGDHFIKMKGKEVFKVAVRIMGDAARDILEQHGVTPDQIALVIPHQANLRIIEALAQQLRLPADRVFVNVQRYGNTSGASVPLALDEARKAGRIRTGDLTLLVAFGAGLTYGSALIRW